MSRSATITLMLVLAMALGLAPLRAADSDKTHEGVVVSANAAKLVMTDKEGKNEHTHAIDAACTVMLNDQAAKLVDLKKGDQVKVTMSEGAAIKIVATRKADK